MREPSLKPLKYFAVWAGLSLITTACSTTESQPPIASPVVSSSLPYHTEKEDATADLTFPQKNDKSTGTMQINLAPGYFDVRPSDFGKLAFPIKTADNQMKIVTYFLSDPNGIRIGIELGRSSSNIPEARWRSLPTKSLSLREPNTLIESWSDWRVTQVIANRSLLIGDPAIK